MLLVVGINFIVFSTPYSNSDIEHSSFSVKSELLTNETSATFESNFIIDQDGNWFKPAFTEVCICVEHWQNCWSCSEPSLPDD